MAAAFGTNAAGGPDETPQFNLSPTPCRQNKDWKRNGHFASKRLYAVQLQVLVLCNTGKGFVGDWDWSVRASCLVLM